MALFYDRINCSDSERKVEHNKKKLINIVFINTLLIIKLSSPLLKKKGGRKKGQANVVKLNIKHSDKGL